MSFIDLGPRLRAWGSKVNLIYKYACAPASCGLCPVTKMPTYFQKPENALKRAKGRT